MPNRTAARAFYTAPLRQLQAWITELIDAAEEPHDI
jgi:hypothetical protein